MKLYLKNFRSYPSFHIEIPDSGLTLLKGENGVGKTTILDAIVYALYGKLDESPYPLGMRVTCKVELEYRDIKITRTGNPNILRVTHKKENYENDVAQSIIEQYFGVNRDEFMVSSYVVQASRNSIISLTPAAQLKFIETLAFEDDSQYDIQDKIKDYCKLTGKNLIASQSRYQLSQQQYEEQLSKCEKLDFSKMKKLPPLETLKKKRDAINDKITKKQSILSALNKKRDVIINASKDVQKLRESRKGLVENLELLKESKDELPEEYTEEDIRNMESKLKSLQSKKLKIEEYTSFLSKKKKLEKLKQEYISDLEDKLDVIEDKFPPDKVWNKFWDDYDTLDERRKQYEEEYDRIKTIKSKIEAANSVIDDIMEECMSEELDKREELQDFLDKEKKRVTKRIDKLDKVIEELSNLKNTAIKYTCPSCDAQLCLHDTELKVYTRSKTKFSQRKYDAALTEKEKLEKDLENIKRWLMRIYDVQDTLNLEVPEHTVDYDPAKLENIYQTASEYEELEEQVDKTQALLDAVRNDESFPDHIQKLIETVKKLETKFKKYSSYEEDLVEELVEDIEELRNKITIAWEARSQHSVISRKIVDMTNRLESLEHKLKTYKKLESLEKLEKKCKRLYNNIHDLTSKKQKITDNIELSHSQSDLQKEKELMNKLKNKVKQFKDEMNVCEDEDRGATGLSLSLKEAKFKAIETIVNNINIYSSSYLEKFIENPIDMKLEIITSKTGKTSLDTHIEYKGAIYKKFGQMSGGEKQKCELAFLLGVHEMVGSNILMLDESMNFLDPDIHADILDMLKESAGDKLFLMVSHIENTGIFDHVINLNK
jgi:DNA repair protein SbcC/Rad50